MLGTGGARVHSMTGKVFLAGVWGEGGCGKQADVSGFSLTRAQEQDLRGMKELKQGTL